MNFQHGLLKRDRQHGRKATHRRGQHGQPDEQFRGGPRDRHQAPANGRPIWNRVKNHAKQNTSHLKCDFQAKHKEPWKFLPFRVPVHLAKSTYRYLHPHRSYFFTTCTCRIIIIMIFFLVFLSVILFIYLLVIYTQLIFRFFFVLDYLEA